MAEPEKRKILLRLKPGETKTIGGVTITAHEDNTSLVYIGKKGNTPVVWANKRALVSLNFKGEASALEMLEINVKGIKTIMVMFEGGKWLKKRKREQKRN